MKYTPILLLLLLTSCEEPPLPQKTEATTTTIPDIIPDTIPEGVVIPPEVLVEPIVYNYILPDGTQDTARHVATGFSTEASDSDMVKFHAFISPRSHDFTSSGYGGDNMLNEVDWDCALWSVGVDVFSQQLFNLDRDTWIRQAEIDEFELTLDRPDHFFIRYAQDGRADYNTALTEAGFTNAPFEGF